PIIMKRSRVFFEPCFFSVNLFDYLSSLCLKFIFKYYYETMKLKYICLLLPVLIIGLNGCKKNENEESTLNENFKIFNSISSSDSGIDFSNTLTENDSLNYFTYPYLYMGAGVAAGDINNDGLIDLYFTGNQASNKLYINKGDLKFEDITEKAG